MDLDGRGVRLPLDRLWVCGAGKASVSMAIALADLAPGVPGMVIAPSPGRTASGRVGGIEILRGNHPVPGRQSFQATAKLMRALARRPATDAILFLLSGGASALLAQPAPGVSQADKRRLGRILLRCGADIQLTNAIRKHVSAVKGGGLLRAAAPRRVITLALSDVIGDSLSVIGSGPTVADPSTFAQAWEGLEGLGVVGQLPDTVRRRLQAGLRGELAEFPAARGPRNGRGQGCIIGSNRIALNAAAAEARRRGYRVRTRRAPLRGDAASQARRFAASLGTAAHPSCVLAGGETTVRVGSSAGLGGRCQEFAVAAMEELSGSNWALLAAGTDGVDGMTPAAGGFADPGSLGRAGRRRWLASLATHDSHSLLRTLGDDFSPGPSGTNVMDLVIAVGGPL